MAGKIARVLTELSLNREFDYRIPEALEGEVCVGRVVRMPFGRQRGARGFVTAVVEESEWPNLKELEGVEGDAPLFDERMVKLTKWLAGYYAAPFEKALAAAIPAPVRREGAGFERRWTVRLRREDEGGRAPDEAELEKLSRRAPRQVAAWRWLAAKGAGVAATAADLGVETGVALTGLRAMEKRGWVRLSEDIHWRGGGGGRFCGRRRPS